MISEAHISLPLVYGTLFCVMTMPTSQRQLHRTFCGTIIVVENREGRGNEWNKVTAT